MIDISEIILKRKYYFSLPVPRLYRHLINREVPEIPDLSCDYINNLYDLYDKANDSNYDFGYHDQLTLKTITLMKFSQCRKNERKVQLQCGRRNLFMRPRILWKYYNRNVIARIYDPHKFLDLNFYFKYVFFKNVNEFLRYEQEQRKINLSENEFLLDLAGEYNYDLWLFDRIMRDARADNEQRTLQTSETY